jgi:outer membrane protein OmpA-like peptidoglycan-associated protein
MLILRRFPFLLLSTLLVLSIGAVGQKELTTASKKAQKAYRQAEKYIYTMDYAAALSCAHRAVELDENFTEGYLLLGDLYAEIQEPLKSIHFYKKASELDPDHYPKARLLAGRTELNEGLYAEAKQDLQLYLNREGLLQEELSQVKRLLERCDFALYSIDHPVPFSPVNMGSQINSSFDEYINAITLDNDELYLTVGTRADSQNVYEIRREDFYLSRFREGVWAPREQLGPPMNTPENEGAMFISPDGRYLLFSACNKSDGYGSCDIYISFRRNDHWGEPENIGPFINSAYWETQPCLGSDGRTLFFVSNRPGGRGGSDIWCSRYLPEGRWSIPVNAGDSINSEEDEMSPFIHPDNQSLYFSSKGHTGMGGYDLFLSRKDHAGNWTKPENLGYPINTSADEINLVVEASAARAYISSDKLGGLGGIDIYSFELYTGIRPKQVSYMKGVVMDAETRRPVKAEFDLTDLETGGTVIESFSDTETGAFLLSLPTDKDYALHVTADGYAFYSEHIALRGIQTILDPFLVNIGLQPIKPDQVVVMRNIFFETDQYILKNESVAELTKLIGFLNENSGVSIEIRGHTDQTGTKEYNDQLSLLRARSVYQYLVDHGIDSRRLQYHGYGFTLPVATNDTEEGRRLNRRTEFRILENHTP